jgi:hypothetical protein
LDLIFSSFWQKVTTTTLGPHFQFFLAKSYNYSEKEKQKRQKEAMKKEKKKVKGVKVKKIKLQPPLLGTRAVF